ncbi:redoxin domain-containing protein [Aquimarina algicola]|uniref:Redoxin domain-containing protein n=1 Tax=Aquimarina algicola TaxID=2589995 RepID=A0A504J861_9FLAO|nr:redoxin domain-containing protein [Aquimarina algicola]TPN87066.1 redoxin domain-containing protein [Aquimarina algicola]
MKLKPGYRAPTFKTIDIFGNEFDLSKINDSKIFLSFFRYAECALCNLRIAELKKEASNFQSQNIEVIAIFQSDSKSIKASIYDRHQLKFTVISDSNFKLYNLYQVTPSWRKLLRTASLKGLKSIARAASEGYKLGGKVEGRFNQIPADFLIDLNGEIKIAHYGTSVIDHIPIREILKDMFWS